jgi:DNA replication protein DnaC
LEVIEERAGVRSTVLTSQLPISCWHEGIGEATISDAVMDRVLHRLVRIELQGDSLRRTPTPEPSTQQGTTGAVEPA